MHPKSRPVNERYTTLLHAVGTSVDRFHIIGTLNELDHAGPLSKLLG